MNPLLDFSGLPRFDAVTPEHVAPAIHQLIDENRRLIERLVAAQTPATWDDFVQPMLDAGERLSRAWGIVGHLHSVNDVPPWREAYNALLPDVSSFYAELGQNLALFAKFRQLADSAGFKELSAARRRIIENDLRDFRLSGAELPEDQKPRFKEIQEELSALEVKFSENLLDATNDHEEWVEDEPILSGLPLDVKSAARAAAAAEGRQGWKFTLHSPSYIPVMQYVRDRDLRARMYKAYVTRASELGRGEWDNTPIILEILKLRQEAAHILGYQNYAEVSLVPKMAESPRQVREFLERIITSATSAANWNLDELRVVAKSSFGIDEIAPWDIAFLSEYLRSSRYGFSENDLKAYFTMPTVLDGMLQFASNLFGVRFERGTGVTWHPDVVHIEVIEGDRLQGHLFLDLYARPAKQEGAWMQAAISRSRQFEAVQVPVAYVICDFTPPFDEVAPSLTHQEVLTLFHEFGHSLHHLLTKVDDSPIAGIRGVEWDAVEIPSQLFECFAWEWDVLQRISRNESTGGTLPRALFDAMLSSRNFHTARRLVVSCVYALFDLVAHMSVSDQAPIAMFREIHQKYSNTPVSSFAFPINQLSHIFSGAYAAGLYSYEWADVLATDIYAMFESAVVPDVGVAETVKRELFESGGSRSMIETFLAIRGREPDPAHYFQSRGLTAADE